MQQLAWTSENSAECKGHPFPGFIYMTFLKLQAYKDVEQINDCQALGMVGDDRKQKHKGDLCGG